MIPRQVGDACGPAGVDHLIYQTANWKGVWKAARGQVAIGFSDDPCALLIDLFEFPVHLVNLFSLHTEGEDPLQVYGAHPIFV